MGKQLWRRLGPLGISCVGKAAVQSKASLEYTTMCLGIPGQIVEITDFENNLAKADFNGVRRTINITCVVSDDRPAKDCVGDWVLVHVGFAMSRVDEEEAQKTLDLYKELGSIEEELGAIRDATPETGAQRS